MSSSLKQLILFIVLMMITSIVGYFHYEQPYHAVPINPAAHDQHWLTIILIPLDSRPPCTQFVEQLAHMAGIKLLMPPSELLDHDQTPAHQSELRGWLHQISTQADAAIISTDMLIHGGLVASRLSLGTIADREDTVQLLATLHQENPSLKMYVFNIIPRLLIADSQENAVFQTKMLKYSMLKDQISIFENSQDIKKLTELEAKIPPQIISHYLSLYEQNKYLNMTLMNMVEQGTLSGLIIGQDDGSPFGIPNMNKEQLQHQLLQKPDLANKVFITRGTDEVALTMLGHLIAESFQRHPRIFVIYSTSEGPQITMPFMPNTVATTVNEKINIAGGQQVNHIDQADFILYIHVGTQKNKSLLKPATQDIKNLVNQGYKVALVDLTEHFNYTETLLPVLISENVDITKLIAYAGWNTTSNSIGTAITQGCIFSQSLRAQVKTPDLLALYQENLEFLTARFLDDLYYQKTINPAINKQLQRSHVNPYHLGFHYCQTNDKIQKLMVSKARWLLREGLYNRPTTVETNQGPKKIIITHLEIQTYLPWQRTFEIWLKSTISLAVINN